MQFQRRDILKSGLAGLAGLASSSSPFAFTTRTRALTQGRRLIVLPMRGGYDGLHMVPPVESAYSSFHLRRPTLAVTDGTNAFSDGSRHAFHPVMTQMKSLWDSGSCALFHQLGWPVPSGSHFYSQDRNASARIDDTLHNSGWVIRAAEYLGLTTTETASTGVGSILDVRQPPGSTYRPLTLRDLDAFVLPENANDPFDIDSVERNAAAVDAEGFVNSTNPVVNLFHSANESAFVLIDDIQAGILNYDNLVGGGTYTSSGFAKNMRDLARLLSVSQSGMPEYDVPLLGVTFSGGFDTHGNQESRLQSLLTDIDTNLKAFVDDLMAMGLFDDTVILVISEFGRRISENGNAGTDHGEGNNGLLIGGCVNGGNHYGNISTPTQLRNEFNVPVSMDFRHVFETLLRDWLCVPANDVAQIIDDPSDPAYRPDLSSLFTC